MRSDPFTDTWMFLIGQQPDQQVLGIFGWVLLALFWALLMGSFGLAIVNWRVDAAQRTMADLWIWIARTMTGAMWFQGALWKLPFPQSPGFFHWTSQIAEHAAFGWHRVLASEVMLPLLPLFQAVAFFCEMAFAISLMLGFAVRLSSLLAIGFVAQLWLGLYRLDFEWPWLFWFMIFTLGWFVVHRAGRSLGLDALLLHKNMLAPSFRRWHALAS